MVDEHNFQTDPDEGLGEGLDGDHVANWDHRAASRIHLATSPCGQTGETQSHDVLASTDPHLIHDLRETDQLIQHHDATQQSGRD